RDETARVTRRYRGNTLILETRFETAHGAVTLIDFMPLRDNQSTVMRVVRGERGTVAMRTELVSRFGGGAIVPWVTRLDSGGLRAVAGPDMLVVPTPVALRGEGLKTVGEFIIAAGQTVPFVIAYAPSHLPPPPPPPPAAPLNVTAEFCKDWAGRCEPCQLLPLPIGRSLLTVQPLTYAP